MDDLAAGLAAAVRLILTLDDGLVEIAARSLAVSGSATLIACAVGLPLGAALAIRRFAARRAVVAALNALMGLPPVTVGLLVYLLLSRGGPLGVLGLLYTPAAMTLAQVVIVTPLVASVAHQAVRDLWAEYRDLLLAMNARPAQRVLTLLWEARRALLTAALAGFGRALGEVGAIMIVGGNIDGATRVLTTAIALETSRGDFALAMGLGLVLVALSLGVSGAAHWSLGTERRGRW